MLYHLLYPLHTSISVFNVFRYITFRTIYAALTAFLICFILGPWVIRTLTHMQIGQYIRDDGPQTHLSKAGTPTMGGTLIVFSIFLSMLLWGDLTNVFIWIVLFLLVMPYVLMRFALSGNFEDAFDFKGLLDFIKAHISQLLVVTLVVFAIHLIAGIVGSIAFCIGVYFTQAWAQMGTAWLYGKLYQHAVPPAPRKKKVRG